MQFERSKVQSSCIDYEEAKYTSIYILDLMEGSSTVCPQRPFPEILISSSKKSISAIPTAFRLLSIIRKLTTYLRNVLTEIEAKTRTHLVRFIVFSSRCSLAKGTADLLDALD